MGQASQAPPQPCPAETPPRKFPAQTERGARIVLLTLREYFEHADIDPDPERAAMDFARAHAACTLVFPDMVMLEKLAQKRQIVEAIDRDPSESNARRVAGLLGIPRRKIWSTLKKVTGIGIAERRRRAVQNYTE
jgi:hypothetical protein